MHTAPAVADLARRLADAAGVTTIVTAIPGLGRDACAYRDPCTGVLRIDIGDIAAAGTLAHEYAHHALGHTTRRNRWFAVSRFAAYSGIGSVLVAFYAPALTWAAQRVTLAALAVFVAATLAAAARSRAEEHAADEYAVRLLDEIGLDGRAAAMASLAEPDPWWYRAGGWIFETHPTTSARLRRIRRKASGPAGAAITDEPS